MKKRLVIKCGTRVLVSDTQELKESIASVLVEECAALRKQGYEIVLVTSGAVALGLRHFQKTRASATPVEKRAASAIGQVELLRNLIDTGSTHSLTFSQLLLSKDDFQERERFIRLRDTIEALISKDTIPILNENDVTALQEIGFRDNDHVAALASLLTESEAVFYLSSTDGLYRYSGGEPVERISSLDAISEETFSLVEKEKDKLSLGGMRSKLLSAQLAQQAGASVWIIGGESPSNISSALAGEDVGTAIRASSNPLGEQLSKRKAWIALVHDDSGSVLLDQGAVDALTKRSKSLLPVGITEVQGEFTEDSVISLISPNKRVVGKGIISLSSSDLRKIVGMNSKEAGATLEKENLDEVINRDNLVIFPK